MDRDSSSEINSRITKEACGQQQKTEVTSRKESGYPGIMSGKGLISVPRPVIEAHKSKTIIGNLGEKLRQSPQESLKSTDFDRLSI